LKFEAVNYLTYNLLEVIQPFDILRGHFGAVSGFTGYQRRRGEIENTIAPPNPNRELYKNQTPGIELSNDHLELPSVRM